MRFVHHADMFVDPTPNAVINQRLIRGLTELIQHTDLTQDEQGTFIRLLILIGVKLACVWQHMKAYGVKEDLLASEVASAPPPKEPIAIEYRVSQDLFLEVDEFLVQVKSCLDHLIKVPVLFWVSGLSARLATRARVLPRPSRTTCQSDSRNSFQASARSSSTISSLGYVLRLR